MNFGLFGILGWYWIKASCLSSLVGGWVFLLALRKIDGIPYISLLSRPTIINILYIIIIFI